MKNHLQMGTMLIMENLVICTFVCRLRISDMNITIDSFEKGNS